MGDIGGGLRQAGRQISLRVETGYSRDVGRGIVRIDYDSMDVVGASSGDVVAAAGTGRIAAKCLPLYPSDEGRGIVRVDGLGRHNLGAAVGDSVSVRKVRAVAAEEASVVPLDPVMPTDAPSLAMALEGMPLVAGNHVTMPYFGGRATFRVADVRPEAEAALATPRTVFRVIEGS